MRHLALPVGHGCRDTVGIQTQPAHTKTCSRTEAAGRNLGIAGQIISVVDHDAGYAPHRFSQIDLQATVLQLFLVQSVDRKWQIEGSLIDAGGGNHHRLQIQRGAVGACLHTGNFGG